MLRASQEMRSPLLPSKSKKLRRYTLISADILNFLVVYFCSEIVTIQDKYLILVTYADTLYQNLIRTSIIQITTLPDDSGGAVPSA
jgi:hypothetical protein